jgi:ATP-dependent Lon protease
VDYIKAEYLDYEIYPVIPMRGVVAFPKMVVHFDVTREKSINAIKEALKNDRKVFVVTQKDVFSEDIKKEDLY